VLTAPVSIVFCGQVSGMGSPGSPWAPDSFPVGMAVPFVTVFNADFSQGGLPASGDLGPASGVLHLGARDHEIDDARLFFAFDDVLFGDACGVELTGSGPTTANGGTSRGISFGLGAALDVRCDPGFDMRFPGQFSWVSGSAELAGQTVAARLPLPATGFRSLAGLGSLVLVGRRRAAASVFRGAPEPSPVG